MLNIIAVANLGSSAINDSEILLNFLLLVVVSGRVSAAAACTHDWVMMDSFSSGTERHASEIHADLI